MILSVEPEVRLKLGEVRTVPLVPPIAVVPIVPEPTAAFVSMKANFDPVEAESPVTLDEIVPRVAPLPCKGQLMELKVPLSKSWVRAPEIASIASPEA